MTFSSEGKITANVDGLLSVLALMLVSPNKKLIEKLMMKLNTKAQ